MGSKTLDEVISKALYETNAEIGQRLNSNKGFLLKVSSLLEETYDKKAEELKEEYIKKSKELEDKYKGKSKGAMDIELFDLKDNFARALNELGKDMDRDFNELDNILKEEFVDNGKFHFMNCPPDEADAVIEELKSKGIKAEKGPKQPNINYKTEQPEHNSNEDWVGVYVNEKEKEGKEEKEKEDKEVIYMNIKDRKDFRESLDPKNFKGEYEEDIDGVRVVHTGRMIYLFDQENNKYRKLRRNPNYDLKHEPKVIQEEILEMYDANGNRFYSNCSSREEAEKMIEELKAEGKEAVIGPKAPIRDYEGKLKRNTNEGYVGVYIIKEKEEKEESRENETEEELER